MDQQVAWCLVASVALLAGCSRQPTSNCEPVERYSTASSAPPIQIPDDLSPPNEADALRLPPGAVANVTPSDRCLESPPPFSGASRLGRERAAEAAEAADVAAPVEAPVVPPEAENGDRVIDN